MTDADRGMGRAAEGSPGWFARIEQTSSSRVRRASNRDRTRLLRRTARCARP